MAVGFYVDVPADLAESLAADGFGCAGSERGVADSALSALAAGANLTTVLVGTHEVVRFVRHLWAAAHRNARDGRHATTVVIEHDGRRVAFSLEHEGFDSDEPPDEVVRGMVALIEALAPRRPGRSDAS
jgi:hypothetical protein